MQRSGDPRAGPVGKETVPLRYDRPGGAQVVAAAALGAALAVLAGTEPRDAAPTRWFVDAVIVVALAAVVVLGRGRQRRSIGAFLVASARAARGWRRRPLAALGVGIWVGFVAAFAAVDAARFAGDRHGLPTLSRVIGDVSAHAWGRSLLALAWVAWGAWTVLGWRWRR